MTIKYLKGLQVEIRWVGLTVYNKRIYVIKRFIYIYDTKITLHLN